MQKTREVDNNVPWQIKTVVGVDVAANMISIWGIIQTKRNVEWNSIGLAIILASVIYAVVWWGLWRGKRWGLVGKAVLLALQFVEVPMGTVIALAQMGLLASGESRRYFGFGKHGLRGGERR